MAIKDVERKGKSRDAADHVIVARNLTRHIAGGTAAHSGHGRHFAEAALKILEGKTGLFPTMDLDKLLKVSSRLGIEPASRSREELARLVVSEALEDYTRFAKQPLRFAASTITPQRKGLLDFLGLLPNNIDHAVADVMHRTSLGCGTDPIPLLLGGISCAVADYDAMQLSADLSDVLSGTPRLVRTRADLGALRADAVNICIHGDAPALRAMVVEAAGGMENEVREAGASGINVVGISCASQELALATGAVDIVVLDGPCIRPSLSETCQCLNVDKVATTVRTHASPDTYVQSREEDAKESARAIIKRAIASFRRRDPAQADVPDLRSEVFVGFSLEQIEELLSKMTPEDPWMHLIHQLREGKIRGLALMAGCGHRGPGQDCNHLTIAQELLRNDVLVLATGCSVGAFAKNGLLSSEATDLFTGPGLKAFLRELSEANGVPLPPIWHMGSCVDNARAMNLATELAKHFGKDADTVPFVVCAPEVGNEGALSLGTWCVALGLPVHIGTINCIQGSALVAEVLTNTAQDVFGGRFIYEPSPELAARKLLNEIERRRWRLRLQNRYQVEKGTPIKAKQLFSKAIDGAIIATGFADQLLSVAIERYGYEQKVEFPETGYALPAILAWEGKEVRRLADIPGVLGQARSLIREEATYDNALSAGEAVMVAAEVIEALKYIPTERPYEGTGYCGFIPDKVLRELGVAFVDDTIPGCAVLVGAAEDPKELARIVRDCQSKGMLIIASFDTIRQLQDQGVKVGLDVMLYPVGEFTQVIHGLNFAIRAALTFGNVQKGDRERLQKYLQKRPKVFVLQLGPIDSIKAAAEFAVLLNGSPIITDQEVEPIPERFVAQPDYGKMVQTAIELRSIQVRLAKVNIPVAYGPAFEGETVRRPDTFVEAGGAAKTMAFELLRMLPEDQVEDGRITVIGKDVDQLPEGSRTPLAIIVDVYGKRMQKDFETVLERRIHQFVNFAEGAWHTGQRNTIWVRLSKNSVSAGLRFKHFGDILVTKIQAEFCNIVSRVQVTIITDEAKANELLPLAKEKYRQRDERLAGLSDESIKEFYSCSLCVPADEDIILGNGSFIRIGSLIEHYADHGHAQVMTFATDHMITRPVREIFINPTSKELVKIALKNGNSLALTPNHKVLVDSLDGLVWKKADELRTGDALVDAATRFKDEPSGSLAIVDYLPDDYLVSDDSFYTSLKSWVLAQSSIRDAAIQAGISYKRLYFALNHNCSTRYRLTLGDVKRLAVTLGRDWNQEKEKIRSFQFMATLCHPRLERDLLYVAGLVASDGCVRWRGKDGRSGVFVQFTNTDPTLSSRFCQIIESYFGKKPKLKVYPPKVSSSEKMTIRSKKPVTVILVNNTLFGRLLNGLGIGYRVRTEKWTGYTISTLPDDLVSAFLRGLFDGDGHVTGNRIGITARTYLEAKHIHLLLKRFNIASYISKGTRGYQTLTTSDGDAIRFRDIIGSDHPSKNLKLKNISPRSHWNHVARYDSVTMACGPVLTRLLEHHGIQKYNLPVNGKSIKSWKDGKARPSKEKLKSVLDAIEGEIPPNDEDFLALRAWTSADVHFQKVRMIENIPCKSDRVFNFSVEDTHNYCVNGIIVKNCQSFAPDHICIVTPERLGLCGAINWLDAKAAKEIAPTGPNQPIPKGEVIDAAKGQWRGVNDAVHELTHGKLERFNAYTMMEDPMTSCGCFEVIVAMTVDMQAVLLVNREFPGMTPVGMKFSTLAGSIGGGKQTPGFIGVGRKYILSKKFISADGGFLRIAWMPKELKTQMYDALKRRAEELGEPDFVDKIADETITDTAEGLMDWMVKVDHPALRMPPLLQ